MSKFKNNLIYYLIPLKEEKKNYYGFIDTGGGKTFLFREKKLIKFVKETSLFIEESKLKNLPKNVIMFIGQNFFKNKIIEFNYKEKTVKELKKYKKKYDYFPMIKSPKNNFIHIDVNFEGSIERFLFDTGATLERNKKQYGISFLNGKLFDKLKKKYKTINNYDDDSSPVIIIPKITIFGKVIKNVKFLRRHKKAFIWMSNITKINHIGAIGGNVLKNFTIICDYKKNGYYIN